MKFDNLHDALVYHDLYFDSWNSRMAEGKVSWHIHNGGNVVFYGIAADSTAHAELLALEYLNRLED